MTENDWATRAAGPPSNPGPRSKGSGGRPRYDNQLPDRAAIRRVIAAKPIDQPVEYPRLLFVHVELQPQCRKNNSRHHPCQHGSRDPRCASRVCLAGGRQNSAAIARIAYPRPRALAAMDLYPTLTLPRAVF